ncbi:hypothetical protein CR513_58618, partial [Mucuna pruriens]
MASRQAFPHLQSDSWARHEKNGYLGKFVKRKEEEKVDKRNKGKRERSWTLSMRRVVKGVDQNRDGKPHPRLIWPLDLIITFSNVDSEGTVPHQDDLMMVWIVTVEYKVEMVLVD